MRICKLQVTGWEYVVQRAHNYSQHIGRAYHYSDMSANSLFASYCMQANAVRACVSVLTWCAYLNCKWWKYLTKGAHNYSQHIGRAYHCSDMSSNRLFTFYLMQENAARECASMRIWCAYVNYEWWKYVAQRARNYSQHIGRARHCSDMCANSLFTLYLMQGNAVRECASMRIWCVHVNCKWWKYAHKCAPA